MMSAEGSERKKKKRYFAAAAEPGSARQRGLGGGGGGRSTFSRARSNRPPNPCKLFVGNVSFQVTPSLAFSYIASECIALLVV